jgi:hypothetical protein
MLEVKLDPGCFSDKATLHLFDQPCEDWQKQIGQGSTVCVLFPFSRQSLIK